MTSATVLLSGSGGNSSPILRPAPTFDLRCSLNLGNDRWNIIAWSDIMRRLPFSFHPVFIFSCLIDALFHCFRTHCSNLPAYIIVDHGGYFRGATDMLLCRISTLMRWNQLMNTPKKTAGLVTPLISGTWPGSSTLWLKCDHLLGHEILTRYVPIGYTTVCCSHIECEHKFAPRTMIIRSCRHVREGKGQWETLDDKNRRPYSITV